jgi:hypothetical protein
VLNIFKIRSCEPFCPSWLWTKILLISASWVARIIGVSHQHPAPPLLRPHSSFPQIIHSLLSCLHLPSPLRMGDAVWIQNLP